MHISEQLPGTCSSPSFTFSPSWFARTSPQPIMAKLPSTYLHALPTTTNTTSKHPAYFVACVATAGGMLFGFDISSMAAIGWGIRIMYFISYGCGYIYGPASFHTRLGPPSSFPYAALVASLPFLPAVPPVARQSQPRGGRMTHGEPQPACPCRPGSRQISHPTRETFWS